MQDRTALIYAAFFAATAAGSYLLIPAAEQARVAGLWAITIISAIALILLLGLAFLPTTE